MVNLWISKDRASADSTSARLLGQHGGQLLLSYLPTHRPAIRPAVVSIGHATTPGFAAISSILALDLHGRPTLGAVGGHGLSVDGR